MLPGCTTLATSIVRGLATDGITSHRHRYMTLYY